MGYLCSIKIDIPGLSSVKIKNLLVKAIESSSNIRQYQVNFVRFGRLVQPRLYHRTKNEVIEVFISRQIKKCYKEFAGMHGLDKKTTPQTLRYKEKKGSLIEEVCINLPDGVAGTLAFELLKYTAKKLKREFVSQWDRHLGVAPHTQVPVPLTTAWACIGSLCYCILCLSGNGVL